MANINKAEFFEKVYGCWLGKNIGGTLGTPFEGRQQLLNVTDFTSPSGKPLANDDLDLQLIWLKALEDYGPKGVNEKVLGEYWINYIPPHWNEYGIGKCNMRSGILPPLSGDYNNAWRDSNGAWIRSEVWACCTPGCPELATKYAWYDACVDHGTGEGTYAELFTSSIESAAFVVSDRDELIRIGLSHIPASCRVAKSVGLALKGYSDGLTWQETRQSVLDDSADLGWFQAPANVAFFVIGWLYGEGDFKKSLLIATSCGDDTDCTAATLGSILGIVGGAKGIPADWKKFIGDDIISVAIDRGSCVVPRTCTELTEHVVNMTTQVLAAYRIPITITEAPTDLTGLDASKMIATKAYLDRLAGMSGALRYDFIHTQASVEYPTGLDICAGGTAEIKITLRNVLQDPRHLDITYYLPEGFTLLEGKKHVTLMHETGKTSCETTFTAKLKAGDSVQAQNRGVIQMVASSRPTVILLPILLLGD